MLADSVHVPWLQGSRLAAADELAGRLEELLSSKMMALVDPGAAGLVLPTFTQPIQPETTGRDAPSRPETPGSAIFKIPSRPGTSGTNVLKIPSRPGTGDTSLGQATGAFRWPRTSGLRMASPPNAAGRPGPTNPRGPQERGGMAGLDAQEADWELVA